MTNPPVQIRWFDAWANQLNSAKNGAALRNLHRWMWSEWKRTGPAVAEETNAALGLVDDDCMQPDIPHLFAGKPDTTDLLFININPGWDRARNSIEDGIVARSEDASWSFCRALFTIYPDSVGPMNWWSQAIGLAWRIVHGQAPQKRTAREKREWADSRVSGWELLPLHSKGAGILHCMDRHPTGISAIAAMRASLGFAIRCSAPVTVVASSIGATLTEELAASERWKEIALADEVLPKGTRAFQVGNRLVVAVPRQLISKYTGTKFDHVAAAIRGLHMKAQA